MTRYLVTSALPYINGVKHLGNLVGSMLPADVYARFRRIQGGEVLFICATDEHGTPAELAAAAAGVPVREYCDVQHQTQARIYEAFKLSFDHFGRSSSHQNHELTRKFAAELERRGFIEERSTEQMYSFADQRFLPDRYVEGTCPNCGYGRARGDQCENCTKLLDPQDLIDPRSAISGSTDLELRETRHLFLLQSRLAPEIESWLATRQGWSAGVMGIARGWLKEGLKDRAITRDLEWGVRVDRPGFEGKVFYVWFDAPIEYLGATKEWSDSSPSLSNDWRSWWYAPNDVEYSQFMAKDNVPFHTVSFPATILGSGQPWKLADRIKGFSWLTYYGGKFSTSSRRGVFMDDALELLPPDYWRWNLISTAPDTSDSSFTWEGLQQSTNKELADVLGNFVNRVMTFAWRHFDGEVPPGSTATSSDRVLGVQLQSAVAKYTRELEAQQFRAASRALADVWRLGNEYFDGDQPWSAIKSDDRSSAGNTIRRCLELIATISLLSEPIIPDASVEIDQMVPRSNSGSWPDSTWDPLIFALTTGDKLGAPKILFKKIDDDLIETWRARFRGGDDD